MSWNRWLITWDGLTQQFYKISARVPSSHTRVLLIGAHLKVVFKILECLQVITEGGLSEGRHKAGWIKIRMTINRSGVLKNLEGDGEMSTLQRDLISNRIAICM